MNDWVDPAEVAVWLSQLPASELSILLREVADAIGEFEPAAKIHCLRAQGALDQWRAEKLAPRLTC